MKLILPTWLIKQIFHLLYYQMAWSYDWVAWSVSFGQWTAWRRLSLSFLHPGPTLELAYGTGGLFVDMLNAGHQPVGVDFSPHMARLASQRLQKSNYAIRVCQAKAQTLPFPADYFSNVVATFPTNYIFEPETVSEIHRVLASRNPSRLIVVLQGHLRGPWPIRPFIEWLYDITGQHAPPPIEPETFLARQNFTSQWKMVDQDGALATLLIADKKA